MKRRFLFLFFIANLFAIHGFCQDPIIGEIKLLPYTFVPEGYLACEGQEVNIADYNELFAVIGTMYGGNGSSTFKLPDLRGRVLVGAGGSYAHATYGGNESVTLVANNLPAHSHTATVTVTGLPCNSTSSSSTAPSGVPGKFANARISPYNTASNALSGNMQSNTPASGSNQSVNMMKPFLTLRYVIAFAGTFPEQY